MNPRTAICLTILALPITATAATDSDKAVNLKGFCVPVVANRPLRCDSMTLIYPAAYKDYVMVMFLRGTQAVAGYSGKLYFDPADHAERMMIDHMYSPGGTTHVFHPDGQETTEKNAEGWQAHVGVCEFYRKNGAIIGVDCGQPMWSFQTSLNQ